MQTDTNVADGVLLRQHQDIHEREEAPQACSIDLHISIPTLVEEMDNVINEAYGAAPERLYFIGKDANEFYQGGAGLHLFDLEELEEPIQCIESNIKIN